ncbi:MAG: DUF3999 domain-containing protein [Betaproteobacteria bacterium]|nr:DUF3999 domain-containing protein [Betaproteobacteria bacterium]
MKILFSVLLALASAAAAAESPDEFGFALSIEGVGGNAFYRVAIPPPVYEVTAFADLRDLRVFNAAGETVPHAFLPLERVTERPAPVTLPFFPLRGPRDARIEDFDLHLDKTSARLSLRVNSRGSKAGQAALLGYLVDASALQEPLSGLLLDWHAAGESYFASVRVEASDDLKYWTTLVADAPLARLVHGAQRLEQRNIAYRSHRAKYLRLRWHDIAQVPRLVGVAGSRPERRAQSERVWKELVAVPDADRRGDYLIDTGGLFALERLALRLPQENSVVPMQILSRASPADPWTAVTHAVVYRLKQDGRELVSAEISVNANSRRYWLLRADANSGGIGAGVLTVKAGWTPREIVFAARGAGPFRLAYGNARARSSALAIETLVPGWRTADAPTLSSASTGGAQILAGDAALRDRIDVKKWSLWGALLAGVALLAWMAWRLVAQMKRQT